MPSPRKIRKTTFFRGADAQNAFFIKGGVRS